MFLVRRAGLFGALEAAIRKAFYNDEADAVDRARRERDAKDQSTRGRQIPLVREGDDEGPDVPGVVLS